MRRSGSLSLLALSLFAVAPALSADGIAVRVTPPNKAQLLSNQRFDIRVEATPTDPSGVVNAITVTIDGVDVTTRGVVDSPDGKAKSWMFRYAEFGVAKERVIAATATGAAGSNAISGSGESRLNVRAWDQSQIKKPLSPPTFADIEAVAAVEARNEERSRPARRAEEALAEEDVHLGKVSPLLFKTREELAAERSPLANVPVTRAKNVILLIGDGMGVAHRTGGRVLAKGYTGGKANGALAMDRFPYNGLQMTSSLNSLITDSAPGAHNYSTGNKTNNGMEGVFPDNTASEDDNPRIEHLSELNARFFGKVTGIVSDAFITDATPAAFLAHTQNRGNGTLVASQYFDGRNATNLKVLLGGGGYHFIPKSTPGSRRTDERNLVQEFKADGWTYVDNATALSAFTPGADARLFGLFNIDNMNVAFDKLKMGDPSVTATFPDQPFLKDMAKKAIDVLSRYPNGFFLMVEGAHIDKQSHRMDGERALYDVIQFDQAVQVALDFAKATNSDADPDNDTLVVVSADHECSGMVLPGVGRPEKKGSRDFVKTYNYAAPRNDSTVFNFTDYVIGANGYPTNPDAPHKLIVNFGAAPDHYEDWSMNAKPRNSSATEGAGQDPGITQNGVAVANPNDPKKTSPGAILLTGVIENGANGGDVETQAVHTMADVPVSAYGPGASQFARIVDNTEAFFEIWNSMLGSYPIPVSF